MLQESLKERLWSNMKSFLEALSVSVVRQNLAVVSTVTMEVSKEYNTWAIKASPTIKSITIKFKLGEPFGETSPDTRHVSSTVTQEGNKFVYIQTPKQEGQKSTKSV